MARPQKIGLDYFPLDVYVDQDDKIVLVEAQHGVVGFGVIIKILMKIYSEGYYYNWNEKEQILFSKRVNVDINTLNNIINDCVKWEMFDSNLFNKYKILTSNGIQIRYFEAASRRQIVEVIKEYLLVKNGALKSFTNLVIVNINKDNDNINTEEVVVNDNISTQRKEENRIEENSIDKYLNILQRIKGFPYDDKIDTEYYLTLEERYPTLDLVKAIQNFSDFKLGKEYKTNANHRLQISNWFKNDVEIYKKNLKPLPKIQDDNYFSRRM